jgi:hypothetical protein
MMVTMLRCVEKMGRHTPLFATCTRRAFRWPTLVCVDLTSVEVKSVEMMESPTSLYATPEHTVSALITQESALLKSKLLI